MDKLTDVNPYDVLGIGQDATKQDVKRALAEKQRAAVNQASRQQALNARNILSSIEKRLVVDSMLPSFLHASGEPSLTTELSEQTGEPMDWRKLLDTDTVFQEDVQALIEATIRYVLGDVSVPEQQVTLLSEFDGLDEFLSEWLK